MPALQIQRPELKLQYHQKINENKIKYLGG
jgi:hypothetical protein